MKTINFQNFFWRLFIFLIAIVFLYSCNNKQNNNQPNDQTDKYGFIPKPGNDEYAQQLAAADHLVDTSIVNVWIRRYKDNLDSLNIMNNKIQKFNSSGKVMIEQDSVLYNSEGFNKQLFLMFFSLRDCIGIRINYGLDSAYKMHQIITGVDTLGHDLYIHLNNDGMQTVARLPEPPPPGVYAGENGLGCPPKICN